MNTTLRKYAQKHHLFTVNKKLMCLSVLVKVSMLHVQHSNIQILPEYLTRVVPKVHHDSKNNSPLVHVFLE